MNVLFICETPLHVFNSLIVKNLYFSDCNNVFLINEDFKGAKTIIKKIKKETIDDALGFSYHNFKSLSVKKRKLLELVNPKRAIDILTEDPKPLSTCNYDIIFFATVTPVVSAVYSYNKKAKIGYLEDGTGTYRDKLGYFTFSYIRKLTNLLNYRKCKAFYPDSIYVSNPKLLNTKYECTIKKANYNDLSYELKDKISNIFSYKIDLLYKSENIIFLDQADLNDEHNLNIDFQIKNLIYEISQGKAICRKHPRQALEDTSNLQIDLNMNLWELVCANCINSDKVLISRFSTAQLSPKLIYSQEPFLVFTYKLYDGFTGKEQEYSIEKFINIVRNLYVDDCKIFVPSSFEDLKSDLLYIEETMYK